jgi:hypothetical protein
MYDSLYAILQRIGIKSEIHACTFELVRVFLSDHFNETEVDFMDKSLKARIDATCYVHKDVTDEMANEMIGKAPQIIAKCSL